MTPLPLLDGDTFVIDNSTSELHQTCPRAAQYGICLRRRGSGDRVPLRFGGIMHKVLDVRYRSCAPMLEQTAAVQSAMVACAEFEFSQWTPPEGEYRNLDRMIELIQRYGEAYPFEPWDIIRLPDGKPFVEVPFAFPLGEIALMTTMWVVNLVKTPDGSLKTVGAPYQKFISSLKVVFIGRIDIGYSYNGRPYLLDHKSSSMATNMAEFELSHQFKGYEWAGAQLIGEPIAGTVINRVVVRKPTRTGESFTFERKLIPAQPGLLKEWQSDMLHIITDFVEMVRRQVLPKHTVWCVGKFGTCQFHRVCTLGDEPDALSPQRRLMLESGDFEEVTWNPLKEGT